ncbi:NACHT domain-containing protein [Gallaecimonas mangrovi]|uniref:NACHT domain-containing protein n=1 Tax=Gallaecimonas mangrovi TaxID=2291597 RepID=UPI000E1FC217|nr:NACHT domain-containing protein [Gallaecimonas mangrovi]
MKDAQKVITLFRKYGFEYRGNISSNDYLAFTYKSGFFHNAELVSLYPNDKSKIEKEMESSLRSLERLGFSTKKSFYDSIDDLEKALFDGFFNVRDWRAKTRKEYDEHSDKILKSLPSDAVNYNYINVPYLKNGKLSEIDLIKDVCSSLTLDGPLLSIIEAPAGFGKTCTSYEIINKLANNNDRGPIPFFTEFSRDRQARIFSHIFIREVDRSFNSVSSDVVIEEVKGGRIVVVLDGFDEILHDSGSDIDSSSKFEEAEPMLETIGELLTDNAKIILTSRRSAIFDGEVFSEWMERYSDKFKINRYRLEKPEVKDWLSPSRLRMISETEINITRLSNPVLLSYLRFVDDVTFSSLCANTEKVVEQYFKSMLEREMDRQQLRMSPDQQKEFLKIIASDMCDNDYTSDSKERLINTIKEKAGSIINEVRKLYSPKDRPTIDKLATTLSNHAFFDRSNRKDGHIEFINEFVFGNYIAEKIIECEGNWISSDERFVEPAVSSYAPRSGAERLNLWVGLSEMKYFLDPSSRMKFEWMLTGDISEDGYAGVEISSLNIRSTDFFKEGIIKDCVFNDCTFNDSFFYFSNFHEVTFINCNFWDCEHSKLLDNVNFYNCKSNNEFVQDEEIEDLVEDQSDFLTDVEKYILHKIWPIGSTSIERLHHFIGIFFKTNDFTKKEITKGIRKLKQRGILQDAHSVNFVEINKERFSDIKILMGRS